MSPTVSTGHKRFWGHRGRSNRRQSATGIFCSGSKPMAIAQISKARGLRSPLARRGWRRHGYASAMPTLRQQHAPPEPGHIDLALRGQTATNNLLWQNLGRGGERPQAQHHGHVLYVPASRSIITLTNRLDILLSGSSISRGASRAFSTPCCRPRPLVESDLRSSVTTT